jgi:uncharacterized protein YndB with AHSA1/START domain
MEEWMAAKERSVTHSTFVIKRTYPASTEKVFAAFSIPAKKRRWFAEGEGFEVEDFEMDFRVGGRERTRFRSKQGGQFTNHTVYQDIVENRRIVFGYTMSMGDRRFSSSQVTVEFLQGEGGTELVFTEQGAYFEGSDGPKLREDGWRQLLEQLGRALSPAN